MNEPTLVYDPTLLRLSQTYYIDGCLYRYLGKYPYASIKSPRYRFSPMSGQRRRSVLSLNHFQLLRKVYQVPGMAAAPITTATNTPVQLRLF